MVVILLLSLRSKEDAGLVELGYCEEDIAKIVQQKWWSAAGSYKLPSWWSPSFIACGPRGMDCVISWECLASGLGHYCEGT
jgi:hypothetical protein